MRGTFISLLVTSLVVALSPVARTQPETMSIVHVPVADLSEAAYLFEHFDETHDHGPGYVELLLWPGDEAELEAAGFDHEVVVADVLEEDRGALPAPAVTVELPGPDRSDYRRLADYNTEMRSLARKHRGLVRVLQLPHQTTEGRRVLGLEIAKNVRRTDGRPTFHIDGVHHAREWPAGEFPMIFAHHLVERFGKDRRVTGLLKRVRVTIVPIVNPDGFDYSRESPVQASGLASTGLSSLGLESYWRKNRRSITGVTVPVAQRNPDAYGVDPNRNYGFMWGDDGGGSSSDRTSQTHRGDEPFSEPESRNIRHLVLHRAVTGLLTNHTYGDLVLRPWGHTYDDAPDERLLRHIGARMAAAMGGYQNQKGIGLYATTGTTDDWSYAATGGLGYTIEHGDAFHPPYAEGVGARWQGVMEAYTIMGEAAASPSTHGIVRGRVLSPNGRPVRARVFVRKTLRTPLGDGNPTGRRSIREVILIRTETDGRGRFTLHLNPSTRPLVEMAGGSEAYALSFGTRGGCEGRRVKVARGERLNLGDIELERCTFHAEVDVVQALPGR